MLSSAVFSLPRRMSKNFRYFLICRCLRAIQISLLIGLKLMVWPIVEYVRFVLSLLHFSFAIIFQVECILKQHYPEASITLSHHIAQIGILLRENAAILNESLKPLSIRTIQAFEVALQQLGLTCPFYLTQNDGTLIRLALLYLLCCVLIEATISNIVVSLIIK